MHFKAVYKKPVFNCILVVLLWGLNSLYSQTYYFYTYCAVEGASSKVYFLFQDINDNVWLGTPGGVSKFDGKEFTNYTSDNGMATQAVRTITQDKENNIWFGHSGGGITVL